MKAPLVVHEYIFTSPLFPYSTDNKRIKEITCYGCSRELTKSKEENK